MAEQRHSVLHLSETILEEEESGTLILLVLLPGEAEGALVVHLLADEELELTEVTGDELDHLGGALHEVLDAVFLAVIDELLLDLGEVCLSPLDEFTLGETLDFIELELILNVNYSLSFLLLFFFIGGDVDSFGALGDPFSLGLDSSLFVDNLVREGVRKEFVS